jgi:hypothetical protein
MVVAIRNFNFHAQSIFMAKSTCLVNHLMINAVTVLLAKLTPFPFSREGLPHDYLNYMGVANIESSTKKRQAFINKLKNLVDKLFGYASPDAAADQVRFILRDL